MPDSEYAGTDSYWLGRLSIIMAASASRLPRDPEVASELLRGELRTFERSPVITPALREMLRKEMR